MATSYTTIVEEMIARLRALQGSGEYVPLARRIVAGAGLSGGGTLEQDVTLALGDKQARAVEFAAGLEGRRLATSEEVEREIQGLRGGLRRVFYRDFQITDPPVERVESVPLRIDEDCVLTRVSLSVGTAGKKPVSVTVLGKRVTLSQGRMTGTSEMSVPVSAGSTVQVAVDPTDAAGVVVSLRLEEKA